MVPTLNKAKRLATDLSFFAAEKKIYILPQEEESFIQYEARSNDDLLERLKVRAKKDNRSLNNYVEKILMEAVYDEPNEETVAAMKEAKEGRTLETLDLAKLKEFVASL